MTVRQQLHAVTKPPAALTAESTSTLERECAALRARREALDRRIEDLRTVLAYDARAWRRPPAVVRRRVLKPKPCRRANRPRMPLRSLLRRLVAQHPGLTATELTRALEGAGITVPGRIGLWRRVHNELYRLVTRGELVRDGRGGYLMAAEPGGPLLSVSGGARTIAGDTTRS